MGPGKQASGCALTPAEVRARGNLYSSYEQDAPVRGGESAQARRESVGCWHLAVCQGVRALCLRQRTVRRCDSCPRVLGTGAVTGTREAAAAQQGVGAGPPQGRRARPSPRRAEGSPARGLRQVCLRGDPAGKRQLPTTVHDSGRCPAHTHEGTEAGARISGRETAPDRTRGGGEQVAGRPGLGWAVKPRCSPHAWQDMSAGRGPGLLTGLAQAYSVGWWAGAWLHTVGSSYIRCVHRPRTVDRRTG